MCLSMDSTTAPESYRGLCRYPREIPELPWYRHTVPQMVMAGFLPFSAIYIEL